MTMQTLRQRSRIIRSAMTLVEIMVALMILTVVGGAMVGILLLSTDIYRRGEFSRSANDEAIAVLGTLEEDLDHLISPSGGGWFYSRIPDGTPPGTSDGNCLLAFTASIDSSIQLKDDFTGLESTNTHASSRQVILWGIANKSLYRKAFPWDPKNPDAILDIIRNSSFNISSTTPVEITKGCLHFGTWLSFDSAELLYHRRQNTTGVPDWENSTKPLLPTLAYAYDSAIPLSSGALPPTPQALRISLTLTGGGSHYPRGTFISDTGTEMRVSGLKGLSTIPGTNYLRIGDEWIQYTDINGIKFTYDPATGRGARRSTQSTHTRNDPVETGIHYSLVRSLTR